MNEFAIGFLIGAALGAMIVVVTAPTSGPTLRGEIGTRIRNAIKTGRDVAAQHERELWADYRQRISVTERPAHER